MFKLGMALIFAVIAALMVFIFALWSDARWTTAFLRGIVGFVVAGCFSYLVVFVLEHTGKVFLDKFPPVEEENEADGDKLDHEQLNAYDDEQEAFDYDEPGEELTDDDFQPLSSDDFIRLTTPPTEQARA